MSSCLLFGHMIRERSKLPRTIRTEKKHGHVGTSPAGSSPSLLWEELLQRWVQEDKEEPPGGQDLVQSRRTWTRAGVWDCSPLWGLKLLHPPSPPGAFEDVGMSDHGLNSSERRPFQDSVVAGGTFIHQEKKVWTRVGPCC